MAERRNLEAIRQALFEEMDRDPAVVLIGEDVGVYGGAFKVSEGLLEKFGWERVIENADQRVRDRGRGGGHGVCGPAAGGGNAIHRLHRLLLQSGHEFRPQSRTTAGARRLPLVLRGPCGGGVHGGPFHSANPEMYFVHTPGLKVSARRRLRRQGFAQVGDPRQQSGAFFRAQIPLPRIKEELPKGDFTVPIGKAVVRREGRDLTIVSYAAMLHTSLEAAAELEKKASKPR